MILDILSLSLIFIFSLILIHRNFKASLSVLMFLSVLLHKELFSIYRWDLMPVRVFMVALVLYSGVKFFIWFVRTRDIKQVLGFVKDPFILLLVLLWIVRGISILNSRNLSASLSLFGFFTTIVFLGVLLYKFFYRKPEEILKYIKFYIFLVFGLCLFGLFQLFLYEKTGVIVGALWNVPNNLPRIGSTFWDVNHFAALLSALLPVLGAFILLAKSIKERTFYILVSLPMIFILFLTNSRSAWILAFVAVLSFLTIQFIRKFGARGIFIVITAIVLIAIPLIISYSNRSSAFRAEVRQYFHYRLDSFDSHFLLLAGAFEVFEKYPIFGGGYGSFFEQFSKTKIASTYFGRDPAGLTTRVPAHTIWGELAAETGVLGLGLFVLFITFNILTLLFIAFKFKDRSEVILASSMFASVLGWMVAGIFYSYNSEFFWLIIFFYFLYGLGIFAHSGSLGDVLGYFFKSNRVGIFTISVIALVLIFVNLGNNHLIPWDEAIYAKVSKNMVVSNNYLIPHWWTDANWFEKPPLYMWLTTVSMKLLGFTSTAVRLPSAILGFSTVIMVYLLGKKLFNKTAAFISAFVLVTTFQFLYYARASMLDVTLTFFITLSLYFYLKAKDRGRVIYWILSGLAMGFGVMTKDVVGLLPLPIIGLYEIYLFFTQEQKFSKKLLRNYFLYFLSGVLVFLPWHTFMLSKFGDSFYNSYIKYHVLDRALNSIEDKGKPFLWYLTVLKVSMRVWFIALIPAIPFALYLSGLFKRGASKNKTQIFLIIWFVFIFLFFSVSKSKLVWYIIPIYPVAALIVGNFIERTIRFVTEKVAFLNSNLVKVLLVYIFVFFGLTYLFINKELIYTSDLTGAESEAIIAKDRIFGIKEPVVVDKIELPLIMFYTDGPFQQVQFADLQKKLKDQGYRSSIIFITKESRFAKFKSSIPKLILEFQEKEWVLGYAPSQLSLDEENLRNYTSSIYETEALILKSKLNNILILPETYSSLQILKDGATAINQRINSASNN